MEILEGSFLPARPARDYSEEMRVFGGSSF